MKSEFLLAFNQICSERGLPPEVVMDALRTALVSAYRRNINVSPAQNVTVEIDQNTGEAAIFVEKEAVDEVHNPTTEVSLEVAQRIDGEVQYGDTVMVESTPQDFGRIAAQTAKQIILQRIREAERDALYEDYIGREGEIINGVVQSITPQAISLNLGRTEALLPRKEQVPGEKYTLHQRLRAYVVEVRRSGRGPQIIVSRSHKNMLRRLLELEVPEIFNGAVEIKSIAREAGARSKVAVAARQPGVDPVGSCVGMRGVRIQSIVNELGGEKIDVIEWDPDPLTFIAKALSPARVLTVHLEESPDAGRTATVVVPDDQLSLAIGREGQNARLAAKLTNWRIDIKSVTEAAREALAKAADAQVQASMGHLADYVHNAATILEQYSATHENYTTEHLLLLRQIIDSVHSHFAAKRRQSLGLLFDQDASRQAVLAEEQARRRSERQKALSRIPEDAYKLPLSDLDLSTRVMNHLKKAKIKNVGQIWERMVEGDEGMLALEGIGPKALSEIKAQVEALSPLKPAEPELEPEIEVETPIEPAVEIVAAPESEKLAAPAEAQIEAAVEIEPEIAVVEAIEPAPEDQVIIYEEPPELKVAREQALAQIPADAYDIPVEVLALSGHVLRSLKQARVENLGQVMEHLIKGDATLLSMDGIDAKALAEIKEQVEIMVSIPSIAPSAEIEVIEQSERPRRPRYEYVADDELEQKTKPKRRRKKARHFVAEDAEESLDRGSQRRRSKGFDEWDG